MTSSEHDELLASLLDKVSTEAAAGKLPNIDALCKKHPQLSEELRFLVGAVMVANAAAEGSAARLSQEAAAADISATRNFPKANRAAHAGSSKALYETPFASLPCSFGEYELLEELGRGGMGIVFRARQKTLGRVVALKLILHGQHGKPEVLARFHQEAKTIAQLDHPAILPIHEFGEVDGRPYFTMPLLSGQTLADKLQTGPMDNHAAASLIRDMARAIHTAHTAGVIHRDLKPANVMIETNGAAFVMDFGLAKQQGQSLTQSGAILGTPAYMAPEQAAGGKHVVGPACDVYCLGALLYAALTARPPLEGPSPVDTVMMVLDQDPLPPRMINRKVDRDLEMIVLRCLQKPQDLRYPSAEALAEDLEAYCNGEPISARSGQFTYVLSRLFRETHHAIILENWGLLWMWHSAVLLVLCLTTNLFHWLGTEQVATWPQMQTPLPYVLLWGGGLGVWVPIFWSLRRRAGPVTAVERHIAHAWAASVISSVMLFFVENQMQLPVLSLSPVLGLFSGMVFVFKAGILSGKFYFHATALFLTGLCMAWMQANNIGFGLSLFGVVSALTFFIPGWKYWRLAKKKM